VKVHLCTWRQDSADDKGVAAVVQWLAEASRKTIEDVNSIPHDTGDDRKVASRTIDRVTRAV
jgi:hypothetical protein